MRLKSVSPQPSIEPQKAVFGGALFFLMFFSSVTAYAASAPTSDDPTIVVFSRHTFRGITRAIGPQTISLPDFGTALAVPTLSYGYDATPHGLVIAQEYAAKGLNQAASIAVKTLGESKKFDRRWDEIRADFSSQRTFWTGLYLREGLGGNLIPFTGCKTTEGQSVDVVSSPGTVKECIPADTLQKLRANSPDLKRFRLRTQALMDVISSATGKEISTLPDLVIGADGKFPPAYAAILNLASMIEMSAELGPPLERLFKGLSREPLSKSGKDAVAASLNAIGLKFFISVPSPVADAIAVHPVDYITSQPKGSHTIVVAHDDFISAILRSLGLISSNDDPDNLAIYPIESFVFALGDSSVSVVRMRIQTKPDGTIPGPYSSWVLWKGTRAQWDEKVAALHGRAQALDFGETANKRLKTLRVCGAEKVDVLFRR